MRHTTVLYMLGYALGGATAAESSRPRGVGPEFAKFYKATDRFTCISNPAIQLDVSKVNDDYCDCPDGSDEPGTSACSFLSPLFPPSPDYVPTGDSNVTTALPGFYCKNKGHQPSYVPFTNVNDGACDHELCCDGSEEWAGVGGVVCEDKCKEIGKQWRKLDEQRKRALGAAVKKRKELVVEASKLRKEVEDRIQTLETEIQGSEKKVSQLEADLKEVERKEKGKVVKGPKGRSRVNVLAELAKGRIEELRESLIDVRGDRNAARDKVKQLESILSTFKEEYNPNFNDEGVKRAVRGWEDYVAGQVKDAEDSDFAAEERDLDEITKLDSDDTGINWKEWEGDDEESDIDALYKFEAYLPASVRDWIDGKLRDLRVMLIENGILADTRSGSESQRVTDARGAVDAAKSGLEESRKQMNKHREDLSGDYGADGVFRALKGHCLSTESGEYTYELCWMERTTQKPKRGGGGDTGMGQYVRMERVVVDDEPAPDGRGLGSGERVALRYENGQHCWNGPSRSTTAILACADKDELWRIVEEEKCVYRMEVGTPAVCGDGTSTGNQPSTNVPDGGSAEHGSEASVKDEL
ncbi:MAG: hypothetical protein M1837_002003 [Sclerophora amabilis]|nr:MAG: hypothetical protein M1837_002003 [Sclerophora amabilis]